MTEKLRAYCVYAPRITNQSGGSGGFDSVQSVDGYADYRKLINRGDFRMPSANARSEFKQSLVFAQGAHDNI